MASSVTLFLLLAFFSSFLISSSVAYNFYVGGKNGWVPNPVEEYNHWAGRNRFLVNDTLTFKSKQGSESVLVVKKDDYYNCNTQNPIRILNTSTSVFKFDHSGPFFFISGNKENCQKGQRLIVVVLAVRPKIVPPFPPSQAPSVPKSPSPVSSPPSISHPPAGSPKSQPPVVSHPPSVSPKAPSPISHPPVVSHPPAISPKASSPSPVISPVYPPLAPSPHAKTPSLSPVPAKSPYLSPTNAPSPTGVKSPSPSPATKTGPATSPSPATTNNPGSRSGPAPAPAPGSGNTGNINAPSHNPASRAVIPSGMTIFAVSVAVGAFMRTVPW